ncbi:NAD(P)/FAD-dependent oxidoreductase [Arvimicrobium flavum]|uniref:NAD(P)/FAD-dependent oxidoreductase n=1 Tax=Arvimicrobium flavum TaxID=3393320 RepID=UPI00237A7903|nr:FAD-binding oxidoreductase [Mesorhizobium shangrilense]
MQRKLDLRTGKPVWAAYRAPSVPFHSLRRDLKTDVLVIGMGISGAMAAEALTAAGCRLVMIDRRGPVRGSTAASTSLVQYEIDQPLTMLAKRIGRDRAGRAWRRARLAVANLNARISELGIPCDLALRPSLYLQGDVLGAEALEIEAEARQAAGLAAAFLSRGRVLEEYGVDRAAIRSHDNLAVDLRKLTAGLLRKALQRGARAFAPVEATALVHHAGVVEVATAAGPVIRADRVVLATGYELIDVVPAAKHRIISTWAIATGPQPRKLWPDRAMMWEASDPYLYLRATSDGRIVCGGEDEDFADEEARDALIEEKAASIADKLGALRPGIDSRPQFAWTGSFGTTTTGLPYVGALPRRPRIFAVMGYGGNGIAYSQIASEMVRAWATGNEAPDADLFAF